MNEIPVRFIFRGNEDPGFFIHALRQSGPSPLLKRCVGNIPPATDPYVCFFPVKDYWRMTASLAKRHNVPHYADAFEPAILADVRASRCALIFDLCNEGPRYSVEIFDELFRWIENNELPAGRVVWLAQNRDMGASCRAAAGPRAEFIEFLHYDYFIKTMAWHFAESGGQKILGVEPEIYADRTFDRSNKDRLLLCLNATPRISRVLTVAALIHHDLLRLSLVSFPGMNYGKPSTSTASIEAYLDANPPLEYLKPSVAKALRLGALTVDAFTETGNQLVAKIDARLYERTFFSLVTETDFSDGSVARVTEKLVKAYCLGHPAIAVGNPQSVRFLTELGFQDTDDLIDRAYESETNPARRFSMVFDEALRQINQIQRDPTAWLGRVEEIGRFNIEHAVSGQFLARYREAYDQTVVARLASIVSR